MNSVLKQIINGILIGFGSWCMAMGAGLILLIILWLFGFYEL